MKNWSAWKKEAEKIRRLKVVLEKITRDGKVYRKESDSIGTKEVPV